MEIEQEANAVKISQDLHKQSSYYNSTRPLSKEAQQLLLTEKLITSGGTPQLVSERIKAPEQIHKSITKYKFMNDGMWMKILIDRNDYPEFQHTSIQQMNAQFQIDSFDFVVQVNDLLDYSLRVTKLREKINPEKSKIYERKTYIYIALYKEKEGDWWSLKY